MIAAQDLLELVQNKLATSEIELPPFHPLALKLQETLECEDYSIDEVVSMISRDQALASEILKVANSPLFSGLAKIATIHDAAVRLGAREVTNVVLIATQKQNYQATNALIAAQMYRLWKHAMSCAVGARTIVEHAGHWELAQESFMAGLFHDIGKLLCLRAIDEVLGAMEAPSIDAETLVDITDVLHVEQGALLMQKWNLPEKFHLVVREHHAPEWDTHNITLTAVRLANLICRKLGVGMHREPLLDLALSEEALCLGIQGKALENLEMKIEDAMSLAA